MKKQLCVLLASALLFGGLTGCNQTAAPAESTPQNTTPLYVPPSEDLGSSDATFGDSLDSLGAYDGFFEEALTDIEVRCVSGTKDCYKLEGNTLTFTNIAEDSVYAISGKLRGNIVIDVGDNYKFDLEMQGLSLVSGDINPITVLSGDEVSLTAKADYDSFIYDIRPAVDEEDPAKYSGAIHSEVDLEVCGKGSLTLVSEHNNGIHTKDDLQLKNLTLLVACLDNALKGNDSVELKSGSTTLIATQGDGIKTSNSNISDKGNQRGTVSVLGGSHTIYAACDGIDTAYNVEVDSDEAVLNIYTDKYSNYSQEVTAVSGDVGYIRFPSNGYAFSVKYYNSDEDVRWVNAEYHSSGFGGRNRAYYYSYPKLSGYSRVQFFVYASDSALGQETNYLLASEGLTPNESYDTFAFSSQGNNFSYQWTNYTTSQGGWGGHGGMGGGNSEKSEHSTKGIKAGNEIAIRAGTVNIKSYDDALHANNDTTLENGETPTGNITVSGGGVTAYCNDDGLHADGTVTVSGGAVSVLNSYEGMEGKDVVISGGKVSVVASDDGLNAADGSGSSFGGVRPGFGGFGGFGGSGSSITISGGEVYIKMSGDGVDANGTLSITGGNIIVSGANRGDTAILDFDSSGTISGGTFIGTGATGMAQNFSSSSTQGVIMARSSGGAGTVITLTDGKGNTILSHTADQDFSCVILSHSKLLKGGTYTLTAGTSKSEITMTDTVYGSGGMGGMGRPGGR